MSRAAIKYEGRLILSVPSFGAEPYLGRNLHNFVYRDRNIGAVFRAAEPFDVDVISERFVEPAKRLEEEVKKEAEELEKKAKETKSEEVKEELRRKAKILGHFRILRKDTSVIKDERDFKNPVYFEYDIRRNFGLIYVVITSQTGKSKPVNLEKAMAEVNKMDISINV